MNTVWRIIFIWGFLLPFTSFGAEGVDIERFEHLNTKDGLSQNSVLSAFCDHRGFLWFGTMNGLNRYDGYEFRIYKAIPGKEYSLSNNRVTKIWEDRSHYLWLRTHDGYYHYLDDRSGRFYTFPFYEKSEEEKSSEIICFLQSDSTEIWLGSTGSGVYRLTSINNEAPYQVTQFLSRGINPITNNSVNFIYKDQAGNIWIGTARGLNYISAEETSKPSPRIIHYDVENSYTSVAELSGRLWFGTLDKGIMVYDQRRRAFEKITSRENFREITLLHKTRSGQVAVGTGDKGFFLYYPRHKSFVRYNLNGNRVTNLFEDSHGLLWVNSENFGVNRIDPEKRQSGFFELTPEKIQPLIDNERQYFFEDSKGNLWIGTHGGGLALYDRVSSDLKFFRNDPQDISTISSNFVHCITEDKAGLLWVGTGQFNGGINKIIPANPTFDYLMPKPDFKDMSENVIRALTEDPAGNFWAATKSGDIYIFGPQKEKIYSYDKIPFLDPTLPTFNVYCILIDEQGYVWLGTKGGGIAVSTMPLDRDHPGYAGLKFKSYQHDPADDGSLSSNMVYSVFQDHKGQIWIGTYGNGISILKEKTGETLRFETINGMNSNLSSDEVRYIYEDTYHNLWFATTFGLDLLPGSTFRDSAGFRVFNYDPGTASGISYNDIIHIYEDSRHRLWFGTFGGGIDVIEDPGRDDMLFKAIRQSDGLVNDAVFGILEDRDNVLWFSTENGISKYYPETGLFENYDDKNGLQASNFNENTCLLTRYGDMIFGTTRGLIFVHPGVNEFRNYQPRVLITGFQIFNKNADFGEPASPLNSSILTTSRIDLTHKQSSFSFEFASMYFLDPLKNQYSYKLENFDEGWIDAKTRRRATYTNLPHGEYLFKVRSANPDGTWSDKATVLPVIIHPPWWLQTWAYIAYVILFLILAEVARRIITRYTRMRNDLKVERRVNEIKLQFFTNISHEIRTPLTLILGPIEDMKKMGSLPGELIKSFDIVRRNGQRMLRLVNQLLDFRKIQNKKMSLGVAKVDYSLFVRNLCENFIYFARQKKILYEVDIPESVHFMWIDAEKIDSVFFNILSNAFKFTTSGKQIRVSWEEGETWVDIIISDQGKGITRERLPLIFERYMSHSDNSDYFTGTGIGLALSNELVKMHSGEILVESEPGKGSTFRVRLLKGYEHYNQEDFTEKQTEPQVHDFEGLAEPATIPMAEGEESSEGRMPVLLLVEDNLEIIDYLKNAFQGEYVVRHALNGIEGLKRVRELQPDLVITDVMMPGMDGIEMTAGIKEDFEISHIPVVMLTAKSNMEDQIGGIKSGAEAYVLKPFNSEYLRAVISNLLKQRELIFNHMSRSDNLSPGKVKITNRDEEFLNDILKAIHENYSDPEFKVERMSQVSNLSRTVFYHKIKGLTGMTPVEFLKQMRLKIAAQILLESGNTISETAYSCGFNDEKYFRKCFKELYGMAPGEYRKKKEQEPG